MSTTIAIRIQETPFDPDKEAAQFRADNNNAGAIVSVLGQVRGSDGAVDALILEHYPNFTEQRVREFAEEAVKRWSLENVKIVHRVGEMNPGEAIVLVAIAAAHRRDAFEAADFLMDYLKSEAPFWKRETSGDKTRWVEPREQDHADKARWKG